MYSNRLSSARLRQVGLEVLMLAASCMLMLSLCFVIVEPTVSQAVTSTFSIRQQVTAEISFLISASNTIMVGALGGITGGTATGTTYAAVQTNSTTGYTMDISFQNAPAMRGDLTGSTAIGNYGTTSTPTYNFFASTSAVFAYSVQASNTSDIAQPFLNNGTSCNTGAASTPNTCWQGPTSTSNYRIINRSTAATTSATTTLVFKVNIPNNPTPAVQSDFYTATATLTAVTQ